MVYQVQKALLINEQLSYIKDCYNINCDISPEKAKQYLNNISFCRLKPYFSTLSNANFSTVIKYYDLDRKLRLIILDAIERIEVALKSVLINRLCETYNNDPLWYNQINCFCNQDCYFRFKKIVDDIV